ncbi:alpha/beta hydrolase family esterase [Mucilaginibacter sp. FT3.2]|uniref:alpha/beta hydrolase family esterase n=1 Tax=Mucilaginibacter sp. FT3.2 TaxID=2723090 RepID=UPI001609BB04|nr:esterase [Mucilaginibacter sp. FT3.2]MBB6231233.1 polyhydroxybutyrate depolymerase [Mucilaginibacter sp. FT3.2]
MYWMVDGTDRQALVYIPATAKTDLTPVIFAFHGFGSDMQTMCSQHRFDKYWPEAIIVWPQGLNSPGGRVSVVDKPGWQLRQGTRNDRDLHFFDTMLQSLRANYKVDDKRIYATGHSNGGAFTYLLWATRGNVLAAVAPSAAPTVPTVNSLLKPLPALQITGTNDHLVAPEKQLETFNTVLKVNSCSEEGKTDDTGATYYPSATGNTTILFKHPGGHIYPQEAIPVVIKFFKSVAKQ